MGWKFWQKDDTETRSVSTGGYTSEVLAARQAWISGKTGLGELTSTVQSCVTLWENGLSLSAVSGTDLLTPSVLGLIARSLALRGEAVFYITDNGLLPVADWDVRTLNSVPTGYKLTLSDAGGGRTQTALAAEVLHVRIGSDASAPWSGTAPLARSTISAELLHNIEAALSEVYQYGSLGTQIVPYPEADDAELSKIGSLLSGRRGRTLLRESMPVTAAGGIAPQSDWAAKTLSPDLSKSMTKETLEAARASILTVFGVLPALFDKSAQGPLVREAQRHLAQWQLTPICNLIAAEGSEKLAAPVTLDCMTPLQAYDAGGRARAAFQVVQLLAHAKEAGLSEAQTQQALGLVNWYD